MITRKAPSLLNHAPSSVCTSCARRLASSTAHTRLVPKPTPFVPDVSTFLSLIGRQLTTHAAKIESWEDLFTVSSLKLKKRGLEPARSRRYLIRWREKFRNGIYGIGGDLKYVNNGEAKLRVLEVPRLPKEDGTMVPAAEYTSVSTTPGMQKIILNIPESVEGAPNEKAIKEVLEEGQQTKDLRKPQGMQLVENRMIKGSFVNPVKGTGGTVATIRVLEGMWEDKLGRKVHGGERRRAEVLHKLRVEESKKARR